MNKLLLFLAVFSATLVTAQNVPSYVPTDSLIGWWPFNGNANDESGTGNNGIVNGAVLSPDRFNIPDNSYYFSSINCETRIDINSFNYNGNVNAIAISFWIKRVGNGCISPRLFEFGNGSGFGVNWSNGNANMDWVTGLTIPDGTWFHLVYNIEPGLIKTYVNGVFNSQHVISNSISSWFSQQVCFGRMNHPAFDAFNGNLDDIGVWNRALTPTEIQDLYNGNGCTYIDTVLLSVTDTLVIDVNFVGLNPIQYEYSLKAYPNPTKDMLFIDSPIDFITQGYSIEVKNPLGQSIYQGPINQSQIQLDLTTWGAGGLYFLHLYDSTYNLMDVKKIILK